MELWEVVENQLSHHQKGGDSTPIVALNRLFKECVQDAPKLEKQTCLIHKEQYTQNDIQNLTARHSRGNPKELNLPIILVEYYGKKYILDGNNRVNFLKKHGCHDAVSVIIIQPKQN